MDDEQRSGNRWEPTDEAPVTPYGARSTGTATAELGRPEGTDPVADAVTPVGASSPRPWRDRLRLLRTKSAAVAAAVFLLGGAGGFVLGHLVGDGDQTGQHGRLGPGQRPDGFGRGDGDGDGRGLGPQNGQQAPGQGGGRSGATGSDTA